MSVELLHGDCLDLLANIPSGSVDAVVTDPPYCSGGFTETAKAQAKNQGLRGEAETMSSLGWFGSDNMTSAGLVWLLRAVASQSSRILKPTGSLLLFCDWRMIHHLAPALESVGLRYRSLVVWKKPNPGMGCAFKPQHEMILHFAGPQAEYHDMATGNVLSCGRVHSTNKLHPTEKPVELMRSLIRVVSPIGGVVLDPFMGGGTTGVAALQEGRSFIGIEREESYYMTAKERTKNELAQQDLFMGLAV